MPQEWVKNTQKNVFYQSGSLEWVTENRWVRIVCYIEMSSRSLYLPRNTSCLSTYTHLVDSYVKQCSLVWSRLLNFIYKHKKIAVHFSFPAAFVRRVRAGSFLSDASAMTSGFARLRLSFQTKTSQTAETRLEETKRALRLWMTRQLEDSPLTIAQFLRNDRKPCGVCAQH